MSDDTHSVGILLVGHGTRSELGTRQYLALAASLAKYLAPFPLEPSFLEMIEPDIDTAIGRLVEHGVTRLVTMPLLLFAAGHAKRDIPEQITAALVRRGRGHIESVQAAHLGCHPAIVELSRLRMEDTLKLNFAAPRLPSGNEECLLLVGRGSRDQSATAEMHEFARLRRQASGGIATEVAFLAMAQPLLHEQLAKLGGGRCQRVIVQPHLLFCGELVDSLQRQVSEAVSRHAQQEWIVVPTLADRPDSITQATQLIRKVILDRIAEAGIHVAALAGGD
jgi:sirohydrochlorin cobaltochelatase